MTEATPERRQLPRMATPTAFEVLVDEQSFPATLTDISAAGLKAHVDPVTFDEIREGIDGVRFGGGAPLAVTLRWGFFDGTFGAAFKDRLMAKPIVDEVIAANTGRAGEARG